MFIKKNLFSDQVGGGLGGRWGMGEEEGTWYPSFEGDAPPGSVAVAVAGSGDNTGSTFIHYVTPVAAAQMEAMGQLDVGVTAALQQSSAPPPNVSVAAPIIAAPPIAAPLLAEETPIAQSEQRKTIQPVTSGTERSETYQQLLDAIRAAQLDLANARTDAERAAAQARIDALMGVSSDYEPGGAYYGKPAPTPVTAVQESQGKSWLAWAALGAALFLGS